MSYPAASLNRSRAWSRLARRGHGGGSVEADLTASDRFVDVGEVLEAPRGGYEDACGLGGDVHPAGRPFLEGSVAVPHRDLAAVEFTQQAHLFAALAGDSRLKIEESLLDRCGGEIVVSHTRNLSTRCDRNRC